MYGEHTCGDRVSKTFWGVDVSADDKCTCNHETKKDHGKDCCKDDFSWIKAKTDETKVHPTFQFSKLDFSVTMLYSVVTSFILTIDDAPVTSFRVSHSPPLPGIAVFLRTRTLLI